MTKKYVRGELVDFSPEEEAQKLADIEEKNSPERKWVNILKERNRLLVESDWTQLGDSACDKAAWKTYRKALRDLGINAKQADGKSDPGDIVFPNPPAGV